MGLCDLAGINVRATCLEQVILSRHKTYIQSLRWCAHWTFTPIHRHAGSSPAARPQIISISSDDFPASVCPPDVDSYLSYTQDHPRQPTVMGRRLVRGAGRRRLAHGHHRRQQDRRRLGPRLGDIQPAHGVRRRHRPAAVRLGRRTWGVRTGYPPGVPLFSSASCT